VIFVSCRRFVLFGDWLGFPVRVIPEAMETSLTSSLPGEFWSELENKFFWWEPVGLQPRSEARILAQAMSLASFEEGRQLEQALGHERLVQAMLDAEPGWIDERSWEFWRGRLMRATGCTIPDGSPRRSFDAGSA
jgi:hypothetical protein